MSDWIGLGVIVLVIVLVLAASAKLGAPPKKISVEEFEKRAREGGSTSTGMFGLQLFLNPKAAKAIEVQQDLRHGYYNKKQVPGEGDGEEVDGNVEVDPSDAGRDGKDLSASRREEKDA